MSFTAIVTARSGSRRLPGKALMPLLGEPAVIFLLNRIKQTEGLDQIIFATSDLESDDQLAEEVAKLGIPVFRGSEKDVLGRFFEASRLSDSDHLIRITGDCPFVNSRTLKFVLESCNELIEFDLATTKPLFPHGIDYEIISSSALRRLASEASSDEDREHIFNFAYGHQDRYLITKLAPPDDLAGFPEDDQFLLDTPEDYERIVSMLETYGDVFVDPSTYLQS